MMYWTPSKTNQPLGFLVEEKGSTPVWMKQVHGKEIIQIHSEKDAAAFFREPVPADGVISSVPDLAVFVHSADCVPLLIHEPDFSKVAAIHAGWKGTLKGIASLAIAEFSPESRVIFGPSIQACCFEVKDDFIESFERAGKPTSPFLNSRQGKTYFDLTRFIVEYEMAGLELKRLSFEHQQCTYCNYPAQPSYRREKNSNRRIKSWIRAAIS